MSSIIKNWFSKGPFSAVRPYLGGGSNEPIGDSAPETKPAPQEPEDGFERSDETPESAAPSNDEMKKGGLRSGTHVACGAFPQVVHLLVDPSFDYAENLSKEVSLPVVSLSDGDVDKLQNELTKPEYAKGFILEGFPEDMESARRLDGLLENVAPQDRRVLSWDLTHDTHQEVLDHYMDLDVLWMVPEAQESDAEDGTQKQMMSCLQGLPALQ